MAESEEVVNFKCCEIAKLELVMEKISMTDGLSKFIYSNYDLDKYLHKVMEVELK
jgi:hypothetical protein